MAEQLAAIKTYLGVYFARVLLRAALSPILFFTIVTVNKAFVWILADQA